MNNYRIYRKSTYTEGGNSSLSQNSLLAIGILDFGTVDALETEITWYRQNMNYDLHVITRMDYGNISRLQEKYPDVTFIGFSSITFSGEMINAFAAECKTNYFLIVRTDGDLVRFDGAKLFSMMEKKEHPAMICGALANSRREIVPCVRAPGLKKEHIFTDSSFPNMKDDTKVDTLYPVMELGLYDRALFQRLRGFDEQIHSEYWQALDWGVRCWLFGYPIYLTQALLFQFPDQLSIIEDLSETEGFERCVTKALCIRQVNGKNAIHRISANLDKDVLKGEVRTRMLWLVKQDYPHLLSTWIGSESGS